MFAQKPSHAPTRDQERRDQHRRRILKSGTILFNAGYASFGCRVRNLSENGAMLEMGETTGVPHSFEFAMTGAEKQTARVIWRDQSRLGIKFS